MDYDEYESLPTNNISVHMSAGAAAGIMEHCIMYPFDSVKTRMQSLTPTVKFNTVRETLIGMVKYEGTFRPYRGVGAVVTGAGPAHALYFSSYEFFKEKLYSKTSLPVYVVPVLSGIVATFLHDSIMVPSEVVKQRLQMYNSPYKTIFDCVRRTYRTEGIAAFYRSYTTQVSMSLPFQCIHFMTYEIGQNILNKDKAYNPKAHIVSGGLAGGVAAAVTTPLDVIKTLLNTQQHRVSGMSEAFKMVYRLGGPSGYFRGLQARIIFHVPSAAICWSTYEFLKYTFIIKYPPSKCKEIAPTGFVSERDLSAKLKPGLLLVVPEVNLEPGTIPKSSMEDRFFNEDLEGAEGGRSRKIGSEKLERTFIEKNDWNTRGTGILAVALNTIHAEEENKERSELLDVTHS